MFMVFGCLGQNGASGAPKRPKGEKKNRIWSTCWTKVDPKGRPKKMSKKHVPKQHFRGSGWPSQRSLKSTQEHQKRLQETSWDPSRRGFLKKSLCFSFLRVPGTLKIELSRRRELNFHFFTLLRFWTQNGSKNVAKMEPKQLLRLPRRLQRRSWQL